MNAAQTIGIAETVTFQVALFATKLYDQSGNACDASQATSAQQPQLLLNVQGGRPALLFLSASTQKLTTTCTFTTAQVYSVLGLEERNATSGEMLLGTFGGAILFGYPSGAASAAIYAGGPGFVTASATDNAFHFVEGVYSSGGSIIAVDGVSTSGLNAGASSLSGTLEIGGTSGAWCNCTASELGVWAGTPSISAMHTNAAAWYGTP